MVGTEDGEECRGHYSLVTKTSTFALLTVVDSSLPPLTETDVFVATSGSNTGYAVADARENWTRQEAMCACRTGRAPKKEAGVAA